jgi:DNA polymerase
MTGLDNRQLEILGKMGIDVWRLRKPPPVEERNQVAEKPVAGYTTEYRSSDGKSDVPGPANDTTSELSTTGSTLDEIAVEISLCQRCQLHESRIKTVPGVGMSPASWMFIGEAPGQNEDQQGFPFVGRAGQLLDAMIAALRMQRSDVFIANTIKCRPPGNRDPLPAEVAECEPFLHRQLAVVKPKVIVALGRISAQVLLKTSEPLGKLRGRVHQYGNTGIPLVVTYHPAYLLRSPQQKSRTWDDLLLAQSIVTPDS